MDIQEIFVKLPGGKSFALIAEAPEDIGKVIGDFRETMRQIENTARIDFGGNRLAAIQSKYKILKAPEVLKHTRDPILILSHDAI